jgi:hypothetical protein
MKGLVRAVHYTWSGEAALDVSFERRVSAQIPLQKAGTRKHPGISEFPVNGVIVIYIGLVYPPVLQVIGSMGRRIA